ncbi:endonuclease/exonuclease/phosphatase family protein [Paenibacillus thiaminolyticus]|uniref:Endonuclease/exonuclease/phosphatase domain-containing protein n=1 Tax=Paenibacillus thiaminolyticus TaxID=49283 RepID=A0AAP9J0S4_PANTH|nr:hypothetical protein FLT43_02010 [Paenibacillus thiaminolyticus]
MAQVIEESQTDIIALNEVDKYFSRRSDNADQLTWLSDRLCMRHSFFGPAITFSSKTGSVPGQYGNAVLSRFPIVLVIKTYWVVPQMQHLNYMRT